MIWQKRTLFLLLFFRISTLGFGQDSLPVGLVQFSYGYQISLFDLSDRYGGHGVIHSGVILKKKNWEIGLNGQYLFGSKVKEDVLVGLRSADGELIGEDHQIVLVDLRQRGFQFGLSLGKSFPINSTSSLVFHLQPGWLMHWIRFQNEGNTFAPIRGDYKYGYDRLTAGFALGEMFSYRFLSKNRLINFEIGIQFTQGFTELKRNIQLDRPNISGKKRIDGLLGLQARWILPIFKRKNADSIYY